MFSTAMMQKISIVFLDDDIRDVTDAIVKEGHLQLVDPGTTNKWADKLSSGGSGEPAGEMISGKYRIEKLISSLEIVSGDKNSNIEIAEQDWNILDRQIKNIEETVSDGHFKLVKIEEEIENTRNLKEKVWALPPPSLKIDESQKYSYLFTRTGKIPEENIESLNSRLQPFVYVLHQMRTYQGEASIIVVSLRQDSSRIEEILKESGFEQPATDQAEIESSYALSNIDSELRELKEKQEEFRCELNKIADKEHIFLFSVLYRIRRDVLKENILKYSRKTKRTFLIAGWLPSKYSIDFIYQINKVTQNRCIIEQRPAEQTPGVKEGKMDVPVMIDNPSFLKPFELLTRAYGVPVYRTIDPTPILALSFLFMFGMMFGDVGHGLILCLTGGFMIWKGAKKLLRQSGMLLIYAGLASMIFGFLFGSIFGVEHMIPALWLKPMDSIDHLFKVVIFFGIGMISLAIIVNIINSFRLGDFFGMIFDKAGLLAAIVYWCGILVASRVVSVNNAKTALPFIIPLLMVSSIFLLFIREPLLHLVKGKKKLFPEGVFSGMMGGVVELLEIVLGFLANTVSFIRVAAFGLAHAGLFLAIFSLSDSVKNIAGGILSIFVLIFGNIVIILLEGLIVSIQAVRLEFYEFFGRFFKQSNISYKPVGDEIRE